MPANHRIDRIRPENAMPLSNPSSRGSACRARLCGDEVPLIATDLATALAGGNIVGVKPEALRRT
jgi:hypothetical protein